MSRLIQFTAALAILLAFLWDNAGGSAMEGLHQWHRAQQQKRQAGASADTVRMASDEYRRLTLRDKHEIRYQGRMYDIHSAAFEGDSVVLAGHYDDFDNELFKVLDELLGEGSGASGDHPPRIFVFTGILPQDLEWKPIFRLEGHAEYHRVTCPMKPSADREVDYAPPEGWAPHFAS